MQEAKEYPLLYPKPTISCIRYFMEFHRSAPLPRSEKMSGWFSSCDIVVLEKVMLLCKGWLHGISGNGWA
jgi:hypothetical protein